MTGFKIHKKNILIISPEPWDSVKVSKHHYALELANVGHEVYFLNPPNYSRYKQLQIAETEVERLRILNYPGQLKGLRFFPSYLRRRFNRQFLHHLESIIRHRIDIIWNFENSRFYDLDFAGDRLKIYHQVDLNQDFHIEEAAASADICFCTTDYIKEKIAAYNSNVFKIHHGVSQSAFGFAELNELNKKPVATLIGNLDIPYLDQDLLRKLIEENEHVQFNLVGGYDNKGDMYQRFSRYSNVVFIGKVNSESIKEYLAQSDILLVCYKANEHKEQLASPHKIMEYLASGKVIIATYTDEYKDKQHLLLMSKSDKEFMSNFRKAINSLNLYNAPDRQAEKIAFAREHTYSCQLVKINEALIKHKLPTIGFFK